MKVLGAIEMILLALGVLLIALFVWAEIYRTIFSEAEIRGFFQDRGSSYAATSVAEPPESGRKLDFTLWSRKRIEEYERSLATRLGPTLAVLRIPKLGLEVPVLEGTDDLTLNRGVGHIAGTSRPGTGGNIGIAGHRDGFFRILKDVVPGDGIELLSPNENAIFTVDRIAVVGPNDVSVLQPRTFPSLTLVTCYPFYYVGSAPQRYIVQASMRDDHIQTPTVTKSSVQLGEH